MSRSKRLKNAVNVFIVCICTLSIFCQFGCQPKQPLFLGERGNFQQHYLTKATKIEYPDVEVQSISEVCQAAPPLTLDNPDPTSMWDITLEESVQMALKNSKVVRTLTGVGFSQAGISGTPSALLSAPAGVRTVYDPALIESDPRTGQEAALSAFDAQLSASAYWNKSDTPSWNGTTTGIRSDAGTFDMTLSKYAATGTQFYVSHQNVYQQGGPTGLAPSSWSNYLEGGFRHPLLRGSGIEFNRIAGPGLAAAPGSYNGVAIARINTDTSLNDFEMSVRNLVADVEKAYWNLYYAYHRLESVRSGRDAAHRTWQQTKNHSVAGTDRGRAQYLAQAEQNYFSFRQQAELAQNNLFKAESAMRYILGLTSTDGRLIRPIDDPITSPIRLDWQNILCEALLRSPELRKQKWEVKRRELELTASKNFLMPRLDLEANYRISGAGKDLLDDNNRRSSAYGSLTGGDYTGWMLGLSASMPLGWRQELAGVRNAQLNLARSRAILQEQELELTHQLSDSFREISLAYQQMQTTMATYRAANQEVEAVRNAYEGQITTLDQYLDAQRRQSESETSYYSSVIDYNLAIMTLHYRKGSLLEYNNVCLSEGQWPAKAYFDAKRRARERDAGHYFNYGFTLPGRVSRGTYQQHQNGYDSASFTILPGAEPRVVPNAMPNSDGMEIVPPASSDLPKVIETEPSVMLPVPMLPQAKRESPVQSEGNVPVSFTAPAVKTTLTPARNMRYVTR